MSDSEYDIRPVVPEDFPAVAVLLRHLLHGDTSRSLAYLNWKYADNPFAERPLGVVALTGHEVVGYRGYYATPWHVPPSGFRTLVLSPGDTVVHPQHRRKGLSVEMGRTATEALQPDYRIFLNFSASASSLPGYLRMGFEPLQDKSRLTLISPGRATRSLLRPKERPLAGVEFGEFDYVQVSPDARPNEMGEVALDSGSSTTRLTPVQDAAFFRWYFRAPGGNHVFYYARDGGRLTGYVVLRVSNSGRLATIIDYSRRSLGAVATILKFIARSRPFGLIWIYTFSHSPEMRRLLHTVGFRGDSAVERLRRRMNRVWPLLVRPVRVDPDEEDWFAGNLDIREIANWEIPEIRSDAI